MQVRRPCAVEEEKMGEVRCVLAYAKAKAIRVLRMRTTRVAIKICRTTQIGEWLT